MNIATILRRSCETWPAATAVVDLDAPAGRRELSYGEFMSLVSATAAGLRKHGLTEGSRVALLMRNSYEYLVTFYAIAAAGLVAVPLNVRLLGDELAHIVADTGSRLIVGEQALLRLHPSLPRLTELGSIETRQAEPGGAPAWETLIEGFGGVEIVECDPERLLTLIYTSGTTGPPKGVMLPHRAWQRVADDAIVQLRYAERVEATLTAGPVTHGPGFFILPTFAVGGRNVLCGAFQADRVLAVFDQEQITNIHLVPTMIRLLLDARRDHKRIGSSLKAVSYAGAAIDVVTLREAIKTFGDVLVQSFGQMEFPMFMTALGPEEHACAAAARPELLHSAGRAVDGVRVKIVAADGGEAPANEVGEIAASGPHAMLGYWNRPDATAETIRDGWVHTGDLGRLDADGYLYVSGRKKDMIITGGMNVYAREVEDVLLGIEGVRRAAVIGVPHRVWGEAVLAVLVAERGSPISSDDVHAACRDRLPGYRRPKAIKWVETLPENAYGKVLKRQLRDEFASLEIQERAR